MAGRLLSDRDHETLRRTIEQVQRQHSNSRGSLARRGVRRHQGGYKPASAAGVGLYYRVATGIKGYANTAGAPRLTSAANTIAWYGATYVVGSETDVGIAYDSAEADPDTDGNFAVNKTGLYKVTYTGKYSINGSTEETIVFDISLYRKPSGSAIAAYEDALTNPTMAFGFPHLCDPAISTRSLRIGLTGYTFFTSGDRLAFRLQASKNGGAVFTNDVRNVDLYVYFERLQDANLSDTTF
jgi:hypothetical protein